MAVVGDTMIAFGATATCIYAGCAVQESLDTAVHVVPVLKDSAKAYTVVTSGGDAVSKGKNKTTVYAYNSKGEFHNNLERRNL